MTKIINEVVRDTNGDFGGYDRIIPPTSKVWNSFIRSVARNNTYCPNITRVIFNLKTTDEVPVLGPDGKQAVDPTTLKPMKKTVKLENPILATVVYFGDGTKVTVTNSDHDKVELDENGYATDASKEAGVVYAIVKRLVGDIDDKGNVNGNGFGRILRQIIEKSYDTQKEEKLRKEQKAKSKAEHDSKIGTSKHHKYDKVSLKNTLVRLNELMDKYYGEKLGDVSTDNEN